MAMKSTNKTLMNIVETSCWKCDKPMKIALVTSDAGFYGPEEFTEQQVQFASSKGAILKKQFSKTTKKEYLANTCGSCGNFIGEFFIHEYLYMGESFEI